eukprot:gene587-627_t
MARANLHVSQEVCDAFFAAQESRNVRVLKVRIQGEEMLLEQVIQKEASVSQDFDNALRNALSETEACFAVFCLTDEDHVSLSWLLLAWVPDGCRVRDKMLYSSSREDIKFSLGLGYFKSEYGANQLSDILWEAYQNSLRKDFDVDLLTETERLVLEEKALTQKESGDVKATALGVIPFALSEEVTEKLNDFKAGTYNWIDVTVANEVVQLLSAKTVNEEEEVKQHMNPDVASFIFGKFTKPDGTSFRFFVFSCPENVPVRMKMTMSSSKASVTAAAAVAGLNFDKNFEVREIDELDEVLRAELYGTSQSETSTTSSSAANVVHSKPQRPGRGRAKVSKFTADA